MKNTTPYVRLDGSVSSVPSSFHNAGTGVDEHGYLVLRPSDLNRVADLVEDGLIERWANETSDRLDMRGRVFSNTAAEGLLRTVLTAHVLPAAEAHAHRIGLTDPSDLDVLVDPDVVTRIATEW
ncbi:hypothetical protein [Microbacterium oleivorans]|uniref:Uncharacterized protein n=1 Tax=Microbacterium oleivorans TaxID=273677 RepID=A0A4R5YPL3_9MICO|nr:hypothetical protein [Microbacterium oleivorans]TDL45287.1 hypothetical protein E2R54_02145 [Microbacterium oleivorans]